MTRELDVRTIPPPRRHPQIFETFDALAPGDAFVLVNDHYPKPLLYQFQAERPGRFDWSLLEAGPQRFRVEIRRRTAETPRSVTEHLEGDHRRLDAMMPHVVAAIGAGDFDAARARFAEFACGLDRHIEIEERLLFPVFERTTGMSDGGPTFVMREEHVEIRSAMAAVTAALAARHADLAIESLDTLTDVLSTHNVKEERMLYPMTDRAIGEDRDRDELVKRMQAF